MKTRFLPVFGGSKATGFSRKKGIVFKKSDFLKKGPKRGFFEGVFFKLKNHLFKVF